jgi:hypothetical protein
MQINISTNFYELWIIPGYARCVALKAHLRYQGDDEIAAASYNSPVMVKDKVDRPDGRSISGAAFNTLREYQNAWASLPA